MTRGLDLLEKGSSAIGKGDFTTKLIVEPYDEIGRLGDASLYRCTFTQSVPKN